MTVDAMENIAPEDWPVVLANLHRALRPAGHLYLTVEEQDEVDFDAVHASLVAQGLPANRGEVVEGDVAGYHFYPGREQVMNWLEDEELDVVDETFKRDNGWGYRHLLLRARHTASPRRARCGIAAGEWVSSAATTVGGDGPLASVRPMLRLDER